MRLGTEGLQPQWVRVECSTSQVRARLPKILSETPIAAPSLFDHLNPIQTLLACLTLHFFIVISIGLH